MPLRYAITGRPVFSRQRSISWCMVSVAATLPPGLSILSSSAPTSESSSARSSAARRSATMLGPHPSPNAPVRGSSEITPEISTRAIFGPPSPSTSDSSSSPVLSGRPRPTSTLLKHAPSARTTQARASRRAERSKRLLRLPGAVLRPAALRRARDRGASRRTEAPRPARPTAAAAALGTRCPRERLQFGDAVAHGGEILQDTLLLLAEGADRGLEGSLPRHGRRPPV